MTYAEKARIFVWTAPVMPVQGTVCSPTFDRGNPGAGGSDRPYGRTRNPDTDTHSVPEGLCKRPRPYGIAAGAAPPGAAVPAAGGIGSGPRAASSR